MPALRYNGSRGEHMRILIDADGCPVVRLCVRIAREYGIESIIYCDSAHVFHIEGVKTVTVSTGADSVDFYLVNQLQKGDIVVTQDYGLAAMCLGKGARALNQNGMEYASDNIDALLFSRYSAKKARMAGERLRGPKKRKPAEDAAFEAALRKMLNKQSV